ncbi:MAG: NTP transferase domain-containing protein [Candidatus Kerfeldbacteria bacterium]|nr:NTP transferase domain-containing protein [Candidatus Kerfeldbacteria bacterium]
MSKQHGRERLTITLRKDLLPQIDATIDGARIRNRSHAIEVLVTNALKPKSRRGLVLAGGSGIKMRPFTYELPKTMLPVKGRPILEYTIDRLRDAGIHDIVIVIGHLGEKIREHFGDGSRFGVKIRYVEEKVQEGTAGPLRLAQQALGHQPFVLVYGDVLIDLDLNDLIEFHSAMGGLATIALTSVKNPQDYGVVKMHGNKIVEFLQKPDQKRSLSHLIYTGVGIMEPGVLGLIPKRGMSMLENDVFPKLAEQDKLIGYPFEGQWFDVGTPDVYEQALNEWPG